MLTFRAYGNGGRSEYIQGACPVCKPEHETEMIAHLLNKSGLQPEEFFWTVDYLVQHEGKTRALEAVRKLLAAAPYPNDWVSLYGSYGVGKSGLLKAAVATLCRAGVSAVYRRADDMLSEAKAVFSADKDAQDASEQAVKSRYRSYQFLAVDEVDRISGTPWAMAFIFSILDDRYNARHFQATMIATNALPGSFKLDFGYLEDRMKDGQRIVIAGPSLRVHSKLSWVARSGDRPQQTQNLFTNKPLEEYRRWETTVSR
jgi:DNA replication protein DnaC